MKVVLLPRASLNNPPLKLFGSIFSSAPSAQSVTVVACFQCLLPSVWSFQSIGQAPVMARQLSCLLACEGVVGAVLRE